MSRVEQTGVSRPLAESLIAEYARRKNGGPPGHWSRYAGVHDPGLSAAYDVEVENLLHNMRSLGPAVKRAYAADGRARERARVREELVRELDDAFRNGQAHVGRSLVALLVGDGQHPSGATAAVGESRSRGARTMKRVLLPLVLLNGIVFGIMAAGPVMYLFLDTPLPPGDARLIALSAFGIWALSFLPGWLFVRFLERRAGSLWDEYVIHLHRLGLDNPGNLPQPPRTSEYYRQWLDHGGLSRMWMRNVYRQKFDAYYGRSVSRFGIDQDQPVKPEALFPVFLCTALLAVGWTAILYDPGQSFGAADNPTPWSMLSFGFAGAYVFFLQTLMRRYFQADLRAGAYVSGYVRVVVALLVVAVLNAALPAGTPASVLVAVAFTVGWFPNAGLQFVIRVAARRLRGVVPSLEPAYPLNRLDGLNIWYETRLLEEGIEDLQNLVSAKLVDVLLHTKVPLDRLVDWVDQALLIIHLPAEPAAVDQQGRSHKSRALSASREGDRHPRRILRLCGVRSASGLIRALHPDRDLTARQELVEYCDAHGLPRAALLCLRDVLAADRRLAAVYNWQSGDVRVRRPLPVDPITWLSAGNLPSRETAAIAPDPGPGVA